MPAPLAVVSFWVHFIRIGSWKLLSPTRELAPPVRRSGWRCQPATLTRLVLIVAKTKGQRIFSILLVGSFEPAETRFRSILLHSNSLVAPVACSCVICQLKTTNNIYVAAKHERWTTYMHANGSSYPWFVFMEAFQLTPGQSLTLLPVALWLQNHHRQGFKFKFWARSRQRKMWPH